MYIISKKTEEFLKQVHTYVERLTDNIKEQFDALEAMAPCGIVVDRGNRTYYELKCEFENEDERNRYEACLKQVLNFVWQVHDQVIVFIYTRVETFINANVQNKDKFDVYCNQNKNKFKGRGKIYKMIYYLCDEKKVSLCEIYEGAIEIWDNKVRPIRNEIIHEGIERAKIIEEIVPNLLNEANISSNLLEIYKVCIDMINYTLSYMRSLLMAIDDIL